jgi:PEGA domain-containing protein
MLVDPGAHVLVLSRKGFADVALNRTFTRQKNAPLDLALDRLPGRLRITANHAQARVELDGQFVGLAPLDIERPAGRYELTVSADDHESYKAQVDLDPGEDLTLKAKLVEETPSIVERWWFWTLAGVVVTGAVIGTYFAVRPEPERPPLNGGGLGWTVPLH